MNTATLEKSVWIAIYAGMILGMLGLAVWGTSAALGGGLLVTGAVLVVLGVAMIWWRARLGNADSRAPSEALDPPPEKGPR